MEEAAFPSFVGSCFRRPVRSMVCRLRRALRILAPVEPKAAEDGVSARVSRDRRCVVGSQDPALLAAPNLSHGLPRQGRTFFGPRK